MTELTLQEYSQEIEGMLERNSHDEAMAHCRYVLQQYPKYIEAYRLLGKAALDREDDEHASDLFARVLSADPSDFVSRAGLAIINDRKGSFPEAVWHMERAYELAPGNPVVQDELRKLYGRRDGVEPQRIPLTRGALARLYMNGELYSEAVAELRAMLAVEPDRVDLQVLLAEALWRDEQKLEASDVALRVLDKMPYCLDANLILGEIWTSGGREEDAEVPLKRALALDPEGMRAAALFGKSTPIPAGSVQMTALEYTAPVEEAAAEEAPEWLAGLGSAAEVTAGGAEEVPAWLQGIGLPAPEAPVAEAVLPEVAEPSSMVEPVEKAPAEEVEQVPDWLSQLRAEAAPLPAVEAAPEEAEIPDWLQALRPEAAEKPAPAVEEVEEGVPDWLAQLRAEVAPQSAVEAEAAPPEAAAPEEAEIPDWLQALRPEAAGQPAPALEEAESPDWLAQLRAEAVEAPEMEAEAQRPLVPPEEGEIPDWLQALGPEGVQAVAPVEEAAEWPSAFPAEPEAAEPVAAEEQPMWLTGEGAMPSPEEAMAYFAKLSAGKEAELQAQAEAEAEERMASIMGRKPEVGPEAVMPPPAPVQIPEPQEALPLEEAPAMPEWPIVPEVEPGPEAVIEVAPLPEVTAEAEAPAVEEAAPIVEPGAVEGLMGGWPALEVAPLPAVEEAPVVEAPVEAPLAARVPVAEAAGPDWWYQTLTDEEGPVEEALDAEAVSVAEALSFVAPAPSEKPVPAPVAPIVTPPPAPKPAARTPKRLVRTKPAPAAPPKPVVDMESIIARLRANPDDQEALLDMARGHIQLGDLSAAHSAYEELVRRNAAMDDVLSDLEHAVEDNPDHVDLTRLLGDAHMKVGNLQKALKLYRQALKKL